jgi:hypothetical protein
VVHTFETVLSVRGGGGRYFTPDTIRTVRAAAEETSNNQHGRLQTPSIDVSMIDLKSDSKTLRNLTACVKMLDIFFSKAPRADSRANFVQ